MLFRYPFVAMGSGCEMLIDAQDSRTVLPHIQFAVDRISVLEAKYSRYREDSLLSRINREAHSREVEIDSETAHLLLVADELHRITNGRFDPTVGSLQDCWDFRSMIVPDPHQLALHLDGVDWRHVKWLDSAIRFLHPATRLDLGGIVKEYALDCAVATLLALGVRRGLVNLGGDIRIVGRVPSGERAFNIAVAHPRRTHALCAVLRVTEGAVVSSGDYQRYFLRDGRRYHHILDPRSGYPVNLRYTGVTTHGETAMEALCSGKKLFLSDPGPPLVGPQDHAYVVCGETGDPEGWCETPACRVSVYSNAAPGLTG